MIILNSATGFSDSELSLLKAAVDKCNAVMATDAFKAKVMTMTFACTMDTGTQVLAKLAQPLTVDFFIFWPSWWKRHFSREVAYEDSQGVHFDKNKFDGESFAEICNTVGHESTHDAGYVHPYEPCADRDNSVPYQIGDLIELLVDG